MALKVITKPADLPVTVTDISEQCRFDLTAESALVTAYIAAVTEKAEAYLRRALVTQTLELSLCGFPTCSRDIDLPMGTVQSITSVKYLDTDGVEQTMDAGSYYLSADNELVLNRNYIWPICLCQPDSVKIRYVAGYGTAADVPSSIKAWIMINVATLYENRETVVVGTGAMIDLATIANGLIDPLVIW